MGFMRTNSQTLDRSGSQTFTAKTFLENSLCFMLATFLQIQFYPNFTIFRYLLKKQYLKKINIVNDNCFLQCIL